VILPDHLHAIWTVPEQDADFALRLAPDQERLLSQSPRGERISASRAIKGERGIWQRRYWEHTMRDQDDFSRHLDSLRSDEARVRAASARLALFLVSPPGRTCSYPEDWAGDLNIEERAFGER
jgi:putative transposase